MIKKFSLVIMTVFYVVAGIYHLWHPETYLELIPPYLPLHPAINFISGVLEIVLGLSLIFEASRKSGALGIIILLILFIPAHIYLIQTGGCVSAYVCIPAWMAWVRLFPFQFILIAWARWHAK